MAACWMLSAAPSPQSELDTALQLYQDARFGESIVVIDKLLRTSIDDNTRVLAKLYLGLNFLALGNEERAASAFRDLLNIDPDFELPTFTAPRVRSFFANVKKTFKIIPVAKHEPPAKIEAIKGQKLEFELARMRPGYRPTFYYRTGDTGPFQSADLAKGVGALYVSELPAATLMKDKAYSLEYYLEITEPGATQPLLSVRTAQSPFRVPVSIPVKLAEAVPIHKRWWFWTVLGGAVLLGTGGTVTGVLLSQPPPPTGDARVTVSF